jgi:hypothetical protein
VTHLYFLYHVPKTGGQTIRDHLDRHLVRDLDFVHLGRWFRPAALTIDAVASLSSAERDRLRSLGGHPLTRDFAELFPERTIREVVFIREPAARMVSHYNWRCTMQALDGAPVPSFEEFLSEASDNPITGFLGKCLGLTARKLQLSAILAELVGMWMVGTTESMDALAPALFGAMGLEPAVPERSNATGVTIERHLTLTPDLADAIRAESPEDVALYEACRRLEARTMERLGITPKPTPLRRVGFAPG